MGLLDRVSDIIAANLNDLVDEFEDPEKMLRQAVREMEGAICTAMDAAAKVIANEKLLARQVADHRRQAESWRCKAVEAVRRNDDENARHALRRKIGSEKLAAALDDQWTAAHAAGFRLRRQIDAMRIRLAEAQRKLLTLAARKRASRARKQLGGDISAFCSSGDAFSRFELMSCKIEQAEAEAEAFIELIGGEPVGDLAETDVESELSALKLARSDRD